MSTFDFLAFPVRGLVTLAILFIFFLAIYAVLPFRRLSVKSQTPGAAFAAVGWALFSTAFSIYFRYFKKFHCDLRKPGGSDPDDAVAVFLYLYPVHGRGDQLVVGVSRPIPELEPGSLPA